jgi:hypothetical protein
MAYQIWQDIWQDIWGDIWATEGTTPTTTTTTPSGGGRGAKRYGRTVKFNGQFYDSIRDQFRLANDVAAYNNKPEPEAPKPAVKAKKAKPAPKYAPPKVEPYKPDPILELQGFVNALRLKDAENAVNVAKVKRLMAEIDDDDSEILLLT